jgi:hypothetical protein
MRREIFAFLILTSLVSAALDQSYTMTVTREGNSEIVKSMDISVFTGEFGQGALDDVKALCEVDTELQCGVEGNVITITKSFRPGEYYSFEADYGIPMSTYTMMLKKIPTDSFSVALDQILKRAGVVNGSEGGSALPIDLREAEENQENAEFLRRFNANLSYEVIMPSGVGETSTSGSKRGNSVTFDIVSLMEESKPVVIKSGELNMGYLIILGAALVLGGLAFSFFESKPVKKRGKKKKK